MGIPFVSSPATSLGVEWELELVDLETRELRSCASDILPEIVGDDLEHPSAKHELFESTIEINTRICSTVAEAAADLLGTARRVQDAAAARGLGIMSSGTHPFTSWETQETVAKPRYAHLVYQLQWLARRLQIFGVHFHVGVRSSERVIPILNGLTTYLPHILALSASSPYWKGHDTGLASARTKIFEQLPTAGLPQRMSNWDQFEDYVQGLVSSQTIETVREVWWDIRPHPDFGTVELRICDGLASLHEVEAHAALSHCLVQWLDHQLETTGCIPPQPAGWVVRENKWRAVRHGLEAEIIVDAHGEVIPIRRAIEELVDKLVPFARTLHCEAELAGVHAILEGGASYQRQRAVAAAHGGSLVAVVDSLLDEMRAGLVT